ncbi:MAG: hypothetical protein C6I00_03395 [Nitratiruptor sp.]|nr:hypothetical protein [Nitratiruptor sp.]NPA83144.1 lysophospholipid acyltransferase family protein [Campylobacterota bacterium]
MGRWIEYLALKTLLDFAKIAPPSMIFRISDLLARGLFHLDGRRRAITIANLQMALGLPPAEAFQMARRTYRQFGRSLGEMVLLAVDRFDFEGIDGRELQKIAHLSPPFIFITAHIGNWEALAHYIAQRIHPIALVGRAGNNRLIEERIVQPLRNRYGNRLIHKHQAARELVRALRSGQSVGLLLDQRGGQAGVWVDFFNRPASTLPTAYTLQKRFRVPIVPLFLVRQGAKLVLRVFDPLLWEECDEITHTRRINQVYEEIIREYPDQWFWMHERWRT